MTLAVFPTLAGQGISVHKKPRFETVVATSASGREARARRYSIPLYDFELVFDGLDATSAGRYGGLGAQSLQTLAGFFLSQRGQYSPFLFVDPTDHAVSGAPLGSTDGSMTNFPFQRYVGAYIGPVDIVTGVSAVYLNGVAQASGWSYAGNVLTFASAPAAGQAVTADFSFAYTVRFSEDVQEYEEFMQLLMACRTVKLQSVRFAAPSTALATICFIIDDPSVTEWLAPAGLVACTSIQGIGAGQGGYGGALLGGQSGGYGGNYYAVHNPAIVAGVAYPIGVGAGGAGGHPAGGVGVLSTAGGNTTFGPAPSYILAAAGGGNSVTGWTGAGSGNPGGAGAPITFPGGGWNGGGGGGGGAGGPNGPGADGGTGISNGGPGGGGGAADGGSAASGQAGGAARDGTPGGAAGQPGSDGSGGGGGNSSGSAGLNGGKGGEGSGFEAYTGAIAGPGGGAGGGGNGAPGGDGGKWGGGAGAGSYSGGFNGTLSAGGNGGVGALIITCIVKT